MKGIRALVLQDLPHVFPSKSFQRSSTQLHTTASSRRFWSFFEFSSKEENCQDAKKCPSSKDIVSTSLISTNEVDEVSKSAGSPNLIRNISTVPPSNLKRNYNSQFDLKSKGPISCLKLQNVLKQDNLVSLLDGNPVPKTLKWKLKGYKTLRNEQAGDFAFVPGGKSYDFDILTKDELMNSSNYNTDRSRTKGRRNSDAKNEDTICLTTKAIENVEEIFCRNKLIGKDDPIIAKIEKRDMSGVPKISSKLLVGTPNIPPKKEDIKYLPILKTDFSAGQLKYQTQPSVQFSSKPPKNIPKPLPPMMKRQDEGREKLDEAEEKKASPKVGESSVTPPPIPTPSVTPSITPPITPPTTPPITPPIMQPIIPPPIAAASTQTKPAEERKLSPIPEMKKVDSVGNTVQFAKVPEPAPQQEATEAAEAAEAMVIEESVAEPEAVMETEVEAKEEAQPEDDITTSKYALEMLKADEMEEELRESQGGRYIRERRNVSRHLSRGSEEMDVNEGEAESSRSEQMVEMREAESDMNDSELASTNPQVEQLSKGTGNIESPSEALNLKYFEHDTAESKQAADPAATYFAPRKSSRHGRTGFQTIMEKPVMNISNPYEHERVPSSPCAATQAKLLRSNTDGRNSQGSEMGGGKRSTMGGSSGGGSRKPPPASYPPYTSRRSASSNSSNCLTKKLPIAESNGLRAMMNTRNPSSNISTSTMNLRNKNKENQNMKNRKDNKKNNNNKKECKRYCCPALQTPTDCDYTKFQCPNAKHEFINSTKMVHYDPTCLPAEDETEMREFCTDPSAHKKCNRERNNNPRRSSSNSNSNRRNSSYPGRRNSRDDNSSTRNSSTDDRSTRSRNRDVNRRTSRSDDSGNRSAKFGKRNFTNSAYVRRPKAMKSVKRFSSLPAFAIPLLGAKETRELNQKILISPSKCNFSKCKRNDDRTRCKQNRCKRQANKCKVQGDRKGDDNCRKVKGSCDNNACKRQACKRDRRDKDTDACARVKPVLCDDDVDENSCKRPTKVVENPCKTVRSRSKKRDDKKVRSSYDTKNNACKKTSGKLSCSSVTTIKEGQYGIKDATSTLNICGKKREDMCKDRKKTIIPENEKAKESAKERMDRERREIEECKRNIMPKRKKEDKKIMSGLERVISPCKEQLKKKDVKFTKFPFNLISSLQNSKLLNDRLRKYSNEEPVDNDNDIGLNDLVPEKKFWIFHEDLNYPDIPVLKENVEDMPEADDDDNVINTWFFSWFNGCQ